MKNDSKELTTLTFRLPLQLKNKLKKFSVDERDHMANIVVKAINNYIGKNK